MISKISSHGPRFPPEIIQRAMWLYVQFALIHAKISLFSCHSQQHFQHPPSSHLSKNEESLSGVRDEHVAGGSRGRLKICEAQAFRVLLSTT
jgi:hypothetical protein